MPKLEVPLWYNLIRQVLNNQEIAPEGIFDFAPSSLAITDVFLSFIRLRTDTTYKIEDFEECSRRLPFTNL